MGIVAEETFIQVRMLNTSKGPPAVRAIRAQIDKAAYQARMKRTLQCQPGLVMKEAEVRDLIVRNGKVTGVVTDMGGEILSASRDPGDRNASWRQGPQWARWSYESGPGQAASRSGVGPQSEAPWTCHESLQNRDACQNRWENRRLQCNSGSTRGGGPPVWFLLHGAACPP